MSTNSKEKRDQYNCSSKVIHKEICDLRYEIGRTCRDCEYEGNCAYMRYKQWKNKEYGRMAQIASACVHTE